MEATVWLHELPGAQLASVVQPWGHVAFPAGVHASVPLPAPLAVTSHLSLDGHVVSGWYGSHGSDLAMQVPFVHVAHVGQSLDVAQPFVHGDTPRHAAPLGPR